MEGGNLCCPAGVGTSTSYVSYVNDKMDEVNSYMSLFSDDAKLMRKVERTEDCEALQKDLNVIWDWTGTWKC